MGEPQDMLLTARLRLQALAAASCCWGLKISVTLGMSSRRKQQGCLKMCLLDKEGFEEFTPLL